MTHDFTEQRSLHFAQHESVQLPIIMPIKVAQISAHRSRNMLAQRGRGGGRVVDGGMAAGGASGQGGTRQAGGNGPGLVLPGRSVYACVGRDASDLHADGRVLVLGAGQTAAELAPLNCSAKLKRKCHR